MYTQTEQSTQFVYVLIFFFFFSRKLAEKENETVGGEADSTQDVTMQSQKVSLFKPCCGLVCCQPLLDFLLTTVDLIFLFFLAAANI